MIITRATVSVGNRVLFNEDNVKVRVEILKIEDTEENNGCNDYTLRTFTLRALERGPRHYLTGGRIEKDQEFTVGANVKYLDSLQCGGWYFT